MSEVARLAIVCLDSENQLSEYAVSAVRLGGTCTQITSRPIQCVVEVAPCIPDSIERHERKGLSRGSSVSHMLEYTNQCHEPGMIIPLL